MKRISVLLALFAAVAVLPVAGATAAPVPSVVYDATPNPLPPNVASLGFQATSTSEFGDYVHLAGTDRVLKTVTVTMSDWALNSDYPSLPATGWSHPITVNVYESNLGTNGVPDTLLASRTENVTIPWRPAADPTCPGGTAWRATDGNCYNGIAFNITFDLSSSNVTLPDDVIVGIAYNTQSYGSAPIGAPGPYNSLNVGVPTGQTASVGSDDNSDNVFWNTSHAPFYTDGGVAGVGIFRQDTNWSPNGTVAIQITASAPLVGPPTSKDQCKNGGWQTFNNPSFKNQGDCVSYVASGGHHGGRPRCATGERSHEKSRPSHRGEASSKETHKSRSSGSGRPWSGR